MKMIKLCIISVIQVDIPTKVNQKTTGLTFSFTQRFTDYPTGSFRGDMTTTDAPPDVPTGMDMNLPAQWFGSPCQILIQ